MREQPTQVQAISPEELAQWCERRDDVLVIDVRSAAEFETMHIAGSYNVPLSLLTEHAGELAERVGHRAVLVCQSGQRATQAQQRLAAAGVPSATVLTGGVPGFASAGGEVVRGAARWAIERQVRLTAGLIVLISLLIAEFFLPGMRFVAFGISAGLIIAALTNSCLMGQALARMPWNRGPRHRPAREVIGALPAGTTER